MGHRKHPERSVMPMAQAIFMHQGFSIPFFPLNHILMKQLGSWINSQFNLSKSILARGSIIQAVPTRLCPWQGLSGRLQYSWHDSRSSFKMQPLVSHPSRVWGPWRVGKTKKTTLNQADRCKRTYKAVNNITALAGRVHCLYSFFLCSFWKCQPVTTSLTCWTVSPSSDIFLGSLRVWFAFESTAPREEETIVLDGVTHACFFPAGSSAIVVLQNPLI